MSIQQIPIQPLYKKENGMYVLDVMDVPFPSEYNFSERVAISLPPNVIAGNHKHKRVEAFVAFSDDIKLFWRDDTGVVQSISMYEKGQLFVTIIPSFVAHAVWNTSKTDTAFLMEFSTDKPGPVERTILIEH